MPVNQTRPIHDAPLYARPDASILIEPGDFLWLDPSTDEIKPASSYPDQLSEAANQLGFAKLFYGISNGQQLAANGDQNEMPVIQNVEYRFPIDSSVAEVGDYIAIDEASSGTALEDQNCVITTDPAKAIGQVTQREAAAVTEVWGRVLNRHFGPQHGSSNYAPSIGAVWQVQTILMNDLPVTLEKDPNGSNILLYGSLLLVDAEGNTEILKLPPEAECVNELILLKNIGGETITVQNDAAGAVATVVISESLFLHCDGTTWNIVQFVNVT